jgi:hypothetical protein
MPNAIIQCGNPRCTNGTNTFAKYEHPHGQLTWTWTEPAIGDTPNSAPHPQPCPEDGTMCNATEVRCASCGWHNP